MTDSTVNPKVLTFIAGLKAEGFHKVRIYMKLCKSLHYQVQCGKISDCGYGNDTSFFVEALMGKEYCCTFMNNLDCPEDAAGRLAGSAGLLDETDNLEMLGESKDLRGRRWYDVDRQVVVEALVCAEKEALSCRNIDFVEQCEYYQFEETVALIDEDGHYIIDDNGDCSVTVRAVARDGDSVAASSKCAVVNPHDIQNLKDIACMIARRAAKHADFGLHASLLTSGNYSVVLSNTVMAELTGQYLPAFYGDNIYYNRSVLSGKEEKIASGSFSLEEDPFSSFGTCRRRIDDEGTPGTRKYLLRNGKVENALYNKKTAAKTGQRSTGNAFKPGLTGEIGIKATNIILSAKDKAYSRGELIHAAEGGIYITKIEGAFAGADIESGDFSLLASGNRIWNGGVGEAVHQFTISGNICELWQDIEMVGDDVSYFVLDGTCILSPSVKVKKIAVSGI